MDRIQYAYIRVTAQVERFGNRVGRQQKRFLDVVKEDTQRGWCDLKGGQGWGHMETDDDGDP